MSATKSVLLIDAGNTHIKAGEVRNGSISSVHRFGYTDNTFNAFLRQHENASKVLSSVLDEEHTARLVEELTPCFRVTHSTKLPLTLDYETPVTLGMDRICNACAMLRLSKTHISISIDIGTCIKFDILEGTVYKGGSISPGIELRYRAMHEFTGKLPLLDARGSAPMIGNSSHKSMHSGVINGIRTELDGFMTFYRSQYPELTFFITGGDAVYFDFEGKNDIFVIENLTLEGMYTIYSFNAK